jgi:hypothetical protein
MQQHTRLNQHPRHNQLPPCNSILPRKNNMGASNKNGNFASWPGMTLDNVNKHYKHTISIAKGHMAQTRRDTRSTQPKPTLEEENDKTTTEDFTPTDILRQRTHKVYAIITELDREDYTDLTGIFPTTSSKRNT